MTVPHFSKYRKIKGCQVMIRQATEADLAQIMSIVDEMIMEMHLRGSKQWSKDYPSRQDFKRDIDNKELYVYEENKQVVAMCTFSETGHEEYRWIPFTTSLALTIKRLAVCKRHRHQGVSEQLITFAIALAREKKKEALNGDTFKNNLAAQKFFIRHDFSFIAERPNDTGDVPLYYYERRIDDSAILN